MTGAGAITILYEDQLAKGPITDYGPNNLAAACVSDLSQDNVLLLRKHISANPRNGNGKLLDACRKSIPALTSDGRHVIAVFDNDRVRTLLELSPEASDEVVIQRIRSDCSAPGNLYVVLLKQNLESVVRAAGECAQQTGTSLSAERLSAAIQKQSLNARDSVLNAIAFHESRAVRDCILLKVPSWKELCELIATLLGKTAPVPLVPPSS